MIRLGQAAQNALEVARFGGLDTGGESTPDQVVGSQPMFQLGHYGDPAVPADEGSRRERAGDLFTADEDVFILGKDRSTYRKRKTKKSTT